MKEDVLFKKKTFGGFDRTEVISYIQQLKETQHKYKKMLDEKETLVRRLSEENSSLSSRVEILEKSANENAAKNEELEAEIKTLQNRCEMLSKKAEKKSKSNKKLADDTVKMCDELVETAQETAQGIVKKAENEYDGVREKINSTVEQINKAKTMPAKDIKALLKKLSEELNDV